MAERRWGKRFNTEIKISFGENELVHYGLVQDLSIFGFFIVTTKSYPIGTSLRLKISTKDGKTTEMLGTVQWGKERPQTSIWLARDGGLGILIKTFLNGQDHYENLCQQLCKECAQEIKSTCPVNADEANTRHFSFMRKFFLKRDKS